MTVARENKNSGNTSRAMRWLLLLLLVANLLAYFVRGHFGSIEALYQPVRDTVNIDSAVNEHGTNASVAGIELLQQEQHKTPGSEINAASHSNAAASKLNDFASDDLCLFIAMENAVPPYDESDTGVISNGGSHGLQDLTTLKARLASLAINAHLVRVEVVGAKQYMVAASNIAEEDTVATLRSLLAKGYDAFVVQMDKLNRAVVLDIFASEAEANEAAEKFRGSGLAVEILIYAERDVLPRLRLGVPESAKLSRRLWSKLQVDFPGIQKEKKYCQSIAPPA